MDITKELEAEEEVGRINELRRNFVRVVTHQLRNPLNAIKWNAELLLEGDFGSLNEDQKAAVEAIHDSEERFLNRIHDFTILLDVMENELEMHKSDFDIVASLSTVVEEMREKAKQYNLGYRVRFPKDSIMVHADEARLQYAARHLMKNALQYNIEEGSVYITLKKEDNKVIFRVKDTGIGIPEEDRDKIFETFFRGENAMKKIQDASGVGLPIVKYFAEKHDGKVEFETKVGEGSTFELHLPIVADNVDKEG